MATILVVDDHETTRRLLTKFLRLEGHRTIPAGNVWQALAVLETERMDLALLDYDLPGMNGDALLAELDSNPRFADIPVIMQTARPFDAELWREYDHILRGWLVKGEYTPNELLASIEQSLVKWNATEPAKVVR